mmetsp:Transcript_71548/g.231664  ORF Transcript_71548/g.231664 Transcript_71548/m.231664 type:complete len:81 (+) Transcript_71548:160-402(+)
MYTPVRVPRPAQAPGSSTAWHMHKAQANASLTCTAKAGTQGRPQSKPHTTSPVSPAPGLRHMQLPLPLHRLLRAIACAIL